MTVKPREGGGSKVDVHQELEFTGLIGVIFSLTVALSGETKFRGQRIQEDGDATRVRLM
jgi:hypothetical protein